MAKADALLEKQGVRPKTRRRGMTSLSRDTSKRQHQSTFCANNINTPRKLFNDTKPRVSLIKCCDLNL